MDAYNPLTEVMQYFGYVMGLYYAALLVPALAAYRALRAERRCSAVPELVVHAALLLATVGGCVFLGALADAGGEYGTWLMQLVLIGVLHVALNAVWLACRRWKNERLG